MIWKCEATHLLGELAPDGREVDGAARLLEGAVDGVVGDAGAVASMGRRGRGTAEGAPCLREWRGEFHGYCFVHQDNTWKCS